MKSRNPSSDPGSRPESGPLGGLSLADLEAMRLLLSGASVIDWHQLAFHDPAEVHRFLHLNEFDPADPQDIHRLEQLRMEAVEYLTRHFEYRIPEEIAAGVPAQDLFLLASRRGRYQTYSCIVLKVMHVMHHLDGRETLFRLPVSDDQIFGLVEAKVVHVVDALRSAGFEITEFAWSRKSRDSLIAKLLAKKDSIAAHVYDKLRFRLVTRRKEDLPRILQELLHRLIPFNYVIPGESVNKILDLRRMLQEPALRPLGERLQSLDEPEAAPAPSAGSGGPASGSTPGAPSGGVSTGPRNDFSGPGYRIINFVADLPVRLASVLQHVNDRNLCDLDLDPRGVVFVLTEFQVMDTQTAIDNEQGENSHAAYKERQNIMIKARLTRGMRNRLGKGAG
jgi:uncharacterized protein (TIGR04552 family)